MPLLRCPRCGFKFDISYSRAFSCGGCPYVTFGECKYVKCPKCGFEDYYDKFVIQPQFGAQQ